MKVRFAKEIREINQMLGIFRETKSKCSLIISQLRDDTACLEEYKSLEKLFNIDLNILGHHHLVERKNKLMEGIDNIMRLQSTLSIKKARMIPEIDEEEVEDESTSSAHSGLRQFNNFSELIKKESTSEISKEKASKQSQVTTKATEDEKRFAETLAKLRFNATELTSVWTKHRPLLSESSEDKLDRLSKIIGTLKKNGRTLYEEERLKTATVSLLDYQEFNKIITELDRVKMQNEELRSQIIFLVEENQRLRGSSSKIEDRTVLVNSTEVSIQTDEVEEQVFQGFQETLIENEKFKVIKFFKEKIDLKPDLELDSFIFDKKPSQIQESCILKGLNDIGDSVIECIADKPLSPNNSQDYFSTSMRLNTYNEDPMGGQFSFHKRVKTEWNPENYGRSETVPSMGTADLSSVESKLKEIRQNRKRIVDDQDLWNQVENMKI